MTITKCPNCDHYQNTDEEVIDCTKCKEAFKVEPEEPDNNAVNTIIGIEIASLFL